MKKYTVEIYDECNYYDEEMHKSLENTITTAFSYLKPDFDLLVNVSIVSEEEIKELNRDNRQVDSVTDVLSFPMLEWQEPEKLLYDINDYDYDFDTKCVFLGDIILCKQRIEEQAREYGHSLLRESVYLTLHGVLHLMGYDHIEENDKKIMRKKEEEILKILGSERK